MQSASLLRGYQCLSSLEGDKFSPSFFSRQQRTTPRDFIDGDGGGGEKLFANEKCELIWCLPYLVALSFRDLFHRYWTRRWNAIRKIAVADELVRLLKSPIHRLEWFSSWRRCTRDYSWAGPEAINRPRPMRSISHETLTQVLAFEVSSERR